MGNSLRDIAQGNDTSVNQIRQYLKCGMAYIKSRNPHFRLKLLKKPLECAHGVWHICDTVLEV